MIRIATTRKLRITHIMPNHSFAQRRIVYLLLGALLVLTIVEMPSVRATTIDPRIWEQLVADSDFVGVVECETAGGIIARYRVIESWKGMPTGSRFTVRMAVNYWGPQFPVTLVGERYLMTAFKSFPPTNMISTTSGGPVPLWWRNIPADYRLPLWQGRVQLPLGKGEKPLSELGSDHQNFEEFKKAAHELLSLSSEGQEVRLLQALCRKYLFGRLDRDPPGDTKKAVIQRLKSSAQKIQSSSSALEICVELLALAKDYKEELGYPAHAVLSQGGREVTLKYLTKQTLENSKEEQFIRTVEYIERRLGRPPDTKAEPAEPLAPSEQRLAELRKILASGPETPEFGEAFELLTQFDPDPVAKYLVSWTNPNKDWHDADYGYVLGSYFGWRCGKKREVHLKTLLNAQDPFIRVAGAVYLCFEDRNLGIAELEELAKLPGDPGVWAALNLVRRGQKGAIQRALEVLAISGQRGHMSSIHHVNLQLRLITIMSNSAAASGLTQPKPRMKEPGYEVDEATFKKYQESLHKFYLDWWHENESKIRLTDPWLSDLEKQKVD